METKKFKTTPKMSTYLVAFVISKFSKYEPNSDSSSSVPIGLWANPNEVAHLSYANQEFPLILNAFEEYTNINYRDNMTKLDAVALPDFEGAMENWGLLTFR